jgi:hypothetical protein
MALFSQSFRPVDPLFTAAQVNMIGTIPYLAQGRIDVHQTGLSLSISNGR